MKATRRTCPQGHTYLKSSDCPTCPQCEAARKPQSGFLSTLGAPARRALEREGLVTLKKLAAVREQDILALHGMGPASLPKLRAALASAGLAFKSCSGGIRRNRRDPPSACAPVFNTRDFITFRKNRNT